MMQCAPCCLNIDSYADIRGKGVGNATIMHKDILDIKQKFSDKMGMLIYLFVFHKHDRQIFNLELLCKMN